MSCHRPKHSIYLAQVLESLPWNRVDIKVISLEVTRGKLDPSVELEHHYDPHDDIVTFLTGQGYQLLIEIPHTAEKISFELFFVHQTVDMAAAKQHVSLTKE